VSKTQWQKTGKNVYSLGGDLLRWENRRKRSKKLWKGQGDGKRKSKSKVENTEGKRLVEWIEENEWEVLNGNKEGDDIGSRGE
jgi:hypothetical protein